jgi:hypothetical protein
MQNGDHAGVTRLWRKSANVFSDAAVPLTYLMFLTRTLPKIGLLATVKAGERGSSS